MNALQLLALAGLAAITGLPASSQQPGAMNSGPLLTLSGGECLGACPIYSMQVRPNGHYRLHGVRYVRVVGDSEGELGAEVWAKAMAILNAKSFEALKDPLKDCATDGPSSTLAWRNERGETKTL